MTKKSKLREELERLEMVPVYCGITQAAEALRISERQLRRYCVRGDIGQKIGGVWVISEKEIKAFVRAPPGRPTSARRDSKQA